jgi:hypothetical protein
MAKRKIPVTVEESLLVSLRELGGTNVSASVNEALARQVERMANSKALRSLLDEWDTRYGPVPKRTKETAAAVFAELDGVILTKVA